MVDVGKWRPLCANCVQETQKKSRVSPGDSSLDERRLSQPNTGILTNSNQTCARPLKAETLEKETDRLYNEKEERVKRLEMLNAQVPVLLPFKGLVSQLGEGYPLVN